MLMALLWFSFLIITAYLAGYSVIVSLFPGRAENISSDKAIIFSCGLAVLSYAVYLIGIGGLFFKNIIIFMFLSLFVSGAFKYVLSGPKKMGFPVFERFELFLSCNILFFIVVTLFGALAPAIGTDSLCYHLGIPKYFLLQHRISFIPYTMNSLYPFFSEMLFSLGIILDGAVLAKLFHWFSGVMLAMAVYSFSGHFMKKRTGLLAALLCISSPGIFNEMVYAYVDVFLTLYTFLAVMCMIMWTNREREDNTAYLILSGLFTGVALSVKYLAIFMVIPVFFILILDGTLRKIKPVRIMRYSFIFIFISALLSFFWYLRAYIVLGNPVFPVMSEFFKTPVSFDVSHHFSMGRGKDLLSLLKLPWNLALHPGIFGGRGSQTGIQFSVLLPVLFFGLKRGGRWVRYVFFAISFYFLVWFFSVQRDRFLYPVLPLLSVLIAFSFYKMLEVKKPLKNVLVPSFIAVLSVITFFNMGICLYHNRENFNVVLGKETRQHYLERWVTNYETAEFVNKNLDKNARILGFGIYKTYYFDRWTVREKLFNLWEKYRYKYGNSIDMKTFIREKGFTHVLIKRINNQKIEDYIELLIEGKSPIFVSKPAKNIEQGQIEQFFLYEL